MPVGSAYGQTRANIYVETGLKHLGEVTTQVPVAVFTGNQQSVEIPTAQ